MAAKYPLHKAVRGLNIEAVQALVNEGRIDIDEKDAKKNTPLYLAAELGNAEIVEFLLDAAADVNEKSAGGNTPLHRAATLGNLEVFEILLDAGADVHLKNNYEKTPLHIAAKRGDEQMIRLLLEAKADINARSSSGMSPLYEAICNGNEKIVKMFLEAGADVNIKNWDGDTALQYVLDKADFGVAKMLMRAGLDVNSQNKSGKTVMHFAAMQGKNSIIEYLVSQDADLNLKDFGQEWTPLHWAAFKNKGDSHLKTIELLLEKGADHKAKNDKGETPLQMLEKKPEDTEVMDLFSKYGYSLRKKRKLESVEEEQQQQQPSKSAKKDTRTITDMIGPKSAEEENWDLGTMADMLKKLKSDFAEIRKDQDDGRWRETLERKVEELGEENKRLKERISSLEDSVRKLTET